MSSLLMVRHGQASIRGGDYDLLSDQGREQARLLAAYWLERKIIPTRVFVGPRRRHLQTWDAMKEEFRKANVNLEATMIPELDEHAGQHVMARVLAAATAENPQMKEMLAQFQAGSAEAQKEFLKFFNDISRKWVAEEIVHPGVESWAQFRARVTDAIEKILKESPSKQKVAVITSTGPVSVVAGMALDLSDAKVHDLSWVLRNSAWAEFLFTGNRFSLMSFNNMAHLPESLNTFI